MVAGFVATTGVSLDGIETAASGRSSAAFVEGRGVVPYRRHADQTLRRLLAATDVLVIAAALAISMSVVPGARPSGLSYLIGALTLPAWVVLFKAYGLYDRDAKRISHSTVDDLPWIVHALLVGSLALWFLYRVLPGEKLVLGESAAFFGLAVAGIFVGRASARSIARVAAPAERVLFLGGNDMARVLIEKIRSHPEYRLEPVGYVDVDGAHSAVTIQEIPYLGGLGDLTRICRQMPIDRVVVASPDVDERSLTDLIRGAAELNVSVSILPQMVDILGPSVAIDDLEGVTILGLAPPTLTRSSRALKRVVDVAIALPVSILVSPLLLVIAVLVKATSPGPAFFSQERVGRAGRHFRMHKFRTMVRGADEQLEELKRASAHASWLLLDEDPRVTRFGRFLRHYSLDELPQLWNVLRGDMSLVGPRPMPLDVDEKIAGWGRRRLDLTPGITGLWQVLGRTKIPFEEMVKLDYLYVTNWSLWQDIRLLIRTLPAVVRRRGAN
jgi:exopolysaccharide biosynthesis polyprenyl glycosylphosphotransferase